LLLLLLLSCLFLLVFDLTPQLYTQKTKLYKASPHTGAGQG
jgi:hypothetical protein